MKYIKITNGHAKNANKVTTEPQHMSAKPSLPLLIVHPIHKQLVQQNVSNVLLIFIYKIHPNALKEFIQ